MKTAFRIIYIVVVLSAGTWNFLRPVTFWDMLPYMGSVLSLGSSDEKYIHEETYAQFRLHAPEKMKASMIDGHPFCLSVSQNADYFNQHIPFFKIKALYIYTSWAFLKMGVPLFYAVLLPSLLAFLCISIVVYVWLEKHFVPVATCAFCGLVLLLNLNLDAFRIASPDALAAMFLVLSAFFLLEKKKMGVGIIFLLLCVFVRVDFVFFAGILLAYIGLANYKTSRSVFLNCVAGTAGVAAIVLFVRYQSGGYDMYRMFHRAFVELPVNPLEADVHFNTRDYVAGIVKGIGLSLKGKGLYALFILGILLFVLRKGKSTMEERAWHVALIGSLVLKIFIHPIYEVRYLAGYIIILLVLVVIRLKYYLPARFVVSPTVVNSLD
ncbi:MAG TPA: hypothetical protein VK826_13395 [Bacteroidia bacterium]|nr:hypothetical protein [Bacteroidia bacterium]